LIIISVTLSMSQSEFLSLTAVCSISAISRQYGTKDFIVYSCSSIVLIREIFLVLGQMIVAGASFV
jgi:hypothetical protein